MQLYQIILVLSTIYLSYCYGTEVKKRALSPFRIESDNNLGRNTGPDFTDWRTIFSKRAKWHHFLKKRQLNSQSDGFGTSNFRPSYLQDWSNTFGRRSRSFGFGREDNGFGGAHKLNFEGDSVLFVLLIMAH